MIIKWKKWMFGILFFALCFFGGRTVAEERAARTARASASAGGGRLAVVIDDFGYNGEGTEDMLSLPIPFTAAVMPFSEFSEENGEAAQAAGKEVIIHMPMESLTGKPEWVGKKGVFRTMTEAEIQALVDEAFQILPMAVGMNNHMGSAVMEDEKSLKTVLAELKKRDCFFLDSMTTAKSQGSRLAEEAGVPFLARKVFLDSTDDVNVVKKNLRLAAEIALRDGEVVAIGHVGPEGGDITVRAIKELIEELEGEGITFVTAGELE